MDSVYCREPTSFVAAVMVSLSCMLRLELPHVNILSKVDVIERLGPLGGCTLRVHDAMRSDFHGQLTAHHSRRLICSVTVCPVRRRVVW